jgi:hypothetical protein
MLSKPYREDMDEGQNQTSYILEHYLSLAISELSNREPT